MLRGETSFTHHFQGCVLGRTTVNKLFLLQHRLLPRAAGLEQTPNLLANEQLFLSRFLLAGGGG